MHKGDPDLVLGRAPVVTGVFYLSGWRLWCMYMHLCMQSLGYVMLCHLV